MKIKQIIISIMAGGALLYLIYVKVLPVLESLDGLALAGVLLLFTLLVLGVIRVLKY
jgi:hypothetical protein